MLVGAYTCVRVHGLPVKFSWVLKQQNLPLILEERNSLEGCRWSHITEGKALAEVRRGKREDSMGFAVGTRVALERKQSKHLFYSMVVLINRQWCRTGSSWSAFVHAPSPLAKGECFILQVPKDCTQQRRENNPPKYCSQETGGGCWAARHP